jgi:hypothetical protein
MKAIESYTVGNPMFATSKTLSITDRSYLRKVPTFTVAVNNTVLENYDTLDDAYTCYTAYKATMN